MGDGRAARPAGDPVGPARAWPSACLSATAPSASGSTRSSSRPRSSSGTSPRTQLVGIDGVLILASVTVAAIGIAIAWRLFGVRWLVFRRDPDPARVAAITAASAPTRFLYRASLNKWWFDDLNHLLFIELGGRVANLLLVVRPRRHRRLGQRPRHDGLRRRPRPAADPDRSGPELRPRHRARPARHGRVVSRDREPVAMTIDDLPILGAIVFLPLVGALVIAALPRGNHGLIRGTALRLRGRDVGPLAAAARRLSARQARVPVRRGR